MSKTKESHRWVSLKRIILISSLVTAILMAAFIILEMIRIHQFDAWAYDHITGPNGERIKHISYFDLSNSILTVGIGIIITGFSIKNTYKKDGGKHTRWMYVVLVVIFGKIFIEASIRLASGHDYSLLHLPDWALKDQTILAKITSEYEKNYSKIDIWQIIIILASGIKILFIFVLYFITIEIQYHRFIEKGTTKKKNMPKNIWEYIKTDRLRRKRSRRARKSNKHK